MIQAASPDVVVIGGGPAGATTATLIAQAGYRVQLFERETFPRFHIGESLIPETYWVLERLGLLSKLRGSPFVEKRSVQFVTEHGKLSEPFFFHQHRPNISSQTWQVRRAEFDQMMLNNAREQGVQVHENHRVMEALFDGSRCTGVKVRDEATGLECEVPATVVVGASGQSSVIMSRLGLRKWDPELKKAAVWTYFKGAFRDSEANSGATIILQTAGKAGWFWYIPLQDNITSVGVVAGYDYLFKDREQKDLESIFNTELSRCVGLQPRLQGAERVDQYRAAKEYSYRSEEAAGDGWVLVGDAYGFLDPLYSSGVLLALKSGQLAADAVIDGLATGNTSAAQLGRWSPDYVLGMERMRKLVLAFYKGFNFGKFVMAHPGRKGDITDLLIGDLFNPKLDETLRLVEEALAEQLAAISSRNESQSGPTPECAPLVC